MHDTAMEYGEAFFKTYLKDPENKTIVDVGSQDVNGTLRSVAPREAKYIGLDFTNARGVDVVISDPYVLPIETNTVDVLVSSSCFEHSEFFWLLFNECLRILKPSGVMYINAPSDGPFHQFPVDCWRFYPDSGLALQNWGRRSGFDCVLLESFLGTQKTDVWHDFVGVFLKSQGQMDKHPYRMADHKFDCTHARVQR